MEGGAIEEHPIASKNTTPEAVAQHQKDEESNKNKEEYPYIVGGGYKNDVLKQAWIISNHDKSFLLMLSGENGSFSTETKSKVGYYRYGRLYHDYGLCQISNYYHRKHFDESGVKLKETTVEGQLKLCYKLFKGGTKFYGARAGAKNPLEIVFPK